MSDTNSPPAVQALSTRLVVFDAPDELTHAFLENGFTKHGRQTGAWSRPIDPESIEARDLTYELQGVGLKPRFWTPPPLADQEDRD